MILFITKYSHHSLKKATCKQVDNGKNYWMCIQNIYGKILSILLSGPTFPLFT